MRDGPEMVQDTYKRQEYMNLETVQGSLAEQSPAGFWKVVGGFFGLGLVNNAGYVIMIAGAKDLDSSMVGLIFLCSVFPSACIKASGPYWYHLFSYRVRVILCSIMMAISFVTVAVGRENSDMALELLGVSIGSAQSGMGEASFLALSSYFSPSSTALNGWSSGTGFAGIFGYGWVIFFQIALGMTFSETLYIACGVLPLSFSIIFEFILGSPRPEEGVAVLTKLGGSSGDDIRGTHDGDYGDDDDPSALAVSRSPMLSPTLEAAGAPTGTDAVCSLSDVEDIRDAFPSNERRGTTDVNVHRGIGIVNGGVDGAGGTKEAVMTATTATMTALERFKHTLALWPYMVPLAVVYFAEYAMQAGVWASMGFPVSSQAARKEWYQFSNWVYQAGVLIARSSGFLWTPTRGRLWVMPMVQVVLFTFFTLNAFYMLWYDWSLLVLCFLVGLQGGAVYVGGFTLISREVDSKLREFSLSAASLADSFGIVVGDISAIFIQRALYKHYNISDEQ